MTSSIKLSGADAPAVNPNVEMPFNFLKGISKLTLDNYGFPKSRSPRQLLFYMKYLIFIRELLRDSQNEIPEHLNEIIYYLGKCYAFFFK